MGDDAVCGKRNIMAPPRNSRAVIRKLAKLIVISATGICAVCESRSNCKASLPIACSNSCGYEDDTVAVIT